MWVEGVIIFIPSWVQVLFISFCCLENAGKYIQAFEMSSFWVRYYWYVSIKCVLFLWNPLILVVGGVHGGHHAPL